MTPDDGAWGVRVKRIAAKGGDKGSDFLQAFGINIPQPRILRSLATVRLLEVLSEGPIFGMHDQAVSPLQSVYLDGTQVIDDNGNVNFNLKEAYFRQGYPSQDAIPGYPLGEAPYSVGVQMHTGVPVVRTLNTPLSAVRYILRVPMLYGTSDKGDVTEASVTYQFDIQVNGGAWSNVITETITGKTTSPYERAVRVQLDLAYSTVAIRLTRLDPEPADGVQNNVFFSAYVEITDGQIAYDDSAVVAMTIDAEQFPSPPQRGYLVDGLMVEVPSNYDVRAHTYDGDWDGTFKVDWTDNPAWVLYALLTNERWGIGRFLDVTAVDKWSFYEAAQNCDELVPDGAGGTQRRWSCNVVINTRQDAFTILNSVASGMLGLLYWSNGTVFLVQDRRAGPPTRLFTPANVEQGIFDYNGADVRSRWTAVAVSWNDPTDEYNAAVELVQDQTLVAQQGYRETQQAAFGCTVRGQSQRFGRWMIYTNQFETEAVSFKVGLENADMRPGEIIAIADPGRSGTRLGGRLLADDSPDTLTLDLAPWPMSPNPTAWTLYVTTGSDAKPDGGPLTVFACPVVAVDAGNNQVRVSGKRPQMVAGCQWIAASSAVQPTHWRVAAVKDNGKAIYEVLATEHHEEKFDYVDSGVLIPPPVFSLFPTGPLLPPSDLSDSEFIYLDGSGVPQFGVVVSWQASPDPRVRNYMLELMGPDADYRRFGKIVGVTQEVQAMRAGEWTATLGGFDNLGRRTPTITYKFTPVGLSAKPSPPTAVYLAPQGQLTTVTWVPTGEIDVMFWWVKWSPLTDGTALWENATTSIARVSRDTTQITTPARTGTFMVKAIDALGQESESFAAAILQDQITDRVAVASIIEQPAWAGDMGTHWHKSGAQLVLPPPSTPEAVPPGVFPGDRGEVLNATPTRVSVYDFADDLDLGIVCQVAMVAVLLGHGEYLGFVMALWTPLASATPIGAGTRTTMSTWIPLAAAKPLQQSASPNWDAHIEARVSQDGTNFDPWFPLKSTIITGRRFQWRLVGTIYDLATTLSVVRGEVWNEVPLRTERGDDVALDSTGHLTVTYAIGFLATPTVQLTARQGLAPGGNIVITESDRWHFKVEHDNAAGAPVPGGSVDYLVQGYGGFAP